ncbi:hypothetical protein Zmor_000714 [Zophobas morio]|uniref:Neurite outgrowth-associated protein n=1 Tax=Zophobas morio TaxID=2755281 RepID=A0AA38J0K1_9CUCU|nr:hypothetical protein Zmor_000714 [Zophobas morio]
MFIVRKIITPSVAPCVYRNFAKFPKRDTDPGISRRKQLLPRLENEEITDFEELEADFMEVHKLYEQHEKELAQIKEREKYLIVREKYFKEKSPNFLTWHDKEQIRYLHNTEPEEWTIERLSEGFPALPETIKKVVKTNWVKTKQHKITNHDAAVQRNWKLFKQGQMSTLPKDLAEHLNKFTNRALNFKPFVLPSSGKNVQVQSEATTSEFADIIKSYKKIKNCLLESENTQTNVGNEPPKGDTSYAASAPRTKSVTLSELQNKLTKLVEAGKNVNEDERHIINSVKPEKEDKISETRLMDLSKNKYKASTGVRHLDKKEKDYSHLNYPDKITIPKSILKKGTIYKLNDCYYDDDGEFLYRVPGMG